MAPLVEHRVSELKTGDGTRLYAQRWEPSEIRAEIVLVHGFAEHSGRYWRLADDLNRAGYAVSTIDMRGHGRSSGTRGFVRRFDEYCDDLHALVERVRAEHGERPRILLGHSQGGLIAARYLQTRPRHGFVAALLSAPFLGFTPVPAVKDLAARVLGTLIPTFSLPTDIKSETLSHDPDEIARHGSDPLVIHRATAGWYLAVKQAHKAVFTDARKLTLPLLVLQGTGDIVIDRGAVERFVVEVGSEDKSLVMFPELYHEVFNEREPDRGQVITCVLDWLDKQLSEEGE